MMRSPGNKPRAHHPIVKPVFAGDMAMTRDYGQISHTVVARANAISEAMIFWSLITTVFVIGVAMIKGMPV